MVYKSITLVGLLLLFSNIFSQLKVDPSGRIGMGTNWPNPYYKCHIAGNLLLSDYPAANFSEFVFRVGNGWPGTEMGSSKDNIAVWYNSWLRYNDVHAERYLRPSDKTLKKNIKLIDNGLHKVMQLNTYLYEIEDNQFVDSQKVEGVRKEYGFISQEIEKTLNEVDITTDGKEGIKLMEYDQIIPLAISAIQEQQRKIEALQEEIESLKSEKRDNASNFDKQKSTLFQNSPNPFKLSTIIEYSIPEEMINNSQIVIFNLNGTQIKKFNLGDNKENKVSIAGGELTPGMYIYTLIVNNEEVESKRMILLD